MKPLEQYDKNSIMEPEVFEEIFSAESDVERYRLYATFSMRAGELRVKGQWEKLFGAYSKAEKEKKRKMEQEEAERRARDVSLLEYWTNFSDCPYDRMRCGQWIAADDGIRLVNPASGQTDVVACRNPVLITKRAKNMQTGEEWVTIAFRRKTTWEERNVPKTTIAQASKICGLAAFGLGVTSENAKYLVRYLSDLEANNEYEIPEVKSSSKLGWVKGTDAFLPYDTDIVFDSDARFRELHQSIRAHGSRDKWFDHIRYLRKQGRIEVNLMLAASFSSVIIDIVGALPFIVDLWGDTGSGKTVALMVAASVWANPSGREYIKDYASTDVGLEALADCLNSLPVILDDTSKRNKSVENRFEEIIYNLASGKGKTRSNKELGVNRENTWSTNILTNGEKSLTSYVTQGGAINRTLEIESRRDIFPNPQETVDILKTTYGHAGREFIEAIRGMGADAIRRTQRDFQSKLSDDGKAQKQAISLSVILTADKIATDCLFLDGQYIDLEEAKELLADKSDVSDGERCYGYVMDKIAMNPDRFNDAPNREKWGIIENGWVKFISTALNELIKAGGYEAKQFRKWIREQGLVEMHGDDISWSSKGNRWVRIKMRDTDDSSKEPAKSGDSSKQPASGDDDFINPDEVFSQAEIPFEDDFGQ